jgi:hypothetical protein
LIGWLRTREGRVAPFLLWSFFFSLSFSIRLVVEFNQQRHFYPLLAPVRSQKPFGLGLLSCLVSLPSTQVLKVAKFPTPLGLSALVSPCLWCSTSSLSFSGRSCSVKLSFFHPRPLVPLSLSPPPDCSRQNRVQRSTQQHPAGNTTTLVPATAAHRCPLLL